MRQKSYATTGRPFNWGKICRAGASANLPRSQEWKECGNQWVINRSKFCSHQAPGRIPCHLFSGSGDPLSQQKRTTWEKTGWILSSLRSHRQHTGKLFCQGVLRQKRRGKHRTSSDLETVFVICVYYMALPQVFPREAACTWAGDLP